MTKVKEICQRCEKVFLAGPKQFYCPECLHEMAVERGRKGGIASAHAKAKRRETK